jgi:hypothetical protein
LPADGVVQGERGGEEERKRGREEGGLIHTYRPTERERADQPIKICLMWVLEGGESLFERRNTRETREREREKANHYPNLSLTYNLILTPNP